MKINQLIKKTLDIPGISIQSDSHSNTLLLNCKEGYGSMTMFELFPGMTLGYISIHSRLWPVPNTQNAPIDINSPLLINYCIKGRCEVVLNDQNFVYVKENEFSLSQNHAQKEFIYPLDVYEGLEFFLNIPEIIENNSFLFSSFSLDFSKLVPLYCPTGNTYISHCSYELKSLLQKIFSFHEASFPYALEQMRIYSLAFFSYLFNQKNISSKTCTFYNSFQVYIAKKTQEIITSDLRLRYSARELASSFSISETSLKNYFHGVFGQNISYYMREVRMKTAANLLLSTSKSVAEIAELVGYNNQSKFAAVFKKGYQVTPLEYKRKNCKYLQAKKTP